MASSLSVMLRYHVRVLVLDHANGRGDVEHFLFLCAGCHQIKSRVYDWLGRKRDTLLQVEEHGPVTLSEGAGESLRPKEPR